MRNDNLLIISDHNLASINWQRASSGSVLMIVLTPNKAGNLATSESDISERDSWTDSDFSPCLRGAAPDILARPAGAGLTVSHWLRRSASRGKLASTLTAHHTNWSKSRTESNETVQIYWNLLLLYYLVFRLVGLKLLEGRNRQHHNECGCVSDRCLTLSLKICFEETEKYKSRYDNILVLLYLTWSIIIYPQKSWLFFMCLLHCLVPSMLRLS